MIATVFTSLMMSLVVLIDVLKPTVYPRTCDRPQRIHWFAIRYYGVLYVRTIDGKGFGVSWPFHWTTPR